MKIKGLKNKNAEWNDRSYRAGTYYSSKRWMKRHWRKKYIKQFISQLDKDDFNYLHGPEYEDYDFYRYASIWW